MNIFSKLFFKLEKIMSDLFWIALILLIGILLGKFSIAVLSMLLA